MDGGYVGTHDSLRHTCRHWSRLCAVHGCSVSGLPDAKMSGLLPGSVLPIVEGIELHRAVLQSWSQKSCFAEGRARLFNCPE